MVHSRLVVFNKDKTTLLTFMLFQKRKGSKIINRILYYNKKFYIYLSMIKFSTQLLTSLGAKQSRWLWLIALTSASVAAARIAFHAEWLLICIVVSLFAFKEALEYGRRRANSKAKWE